MILASLFILHACFAQKTDTYKIPVMHMRASKAVIFMKKLETTDSKLPVTLSSDDEKGMVIAQGKPDAVQYVRDIVKLIDVQRRQVNLKVNVDSNLDKVSYQVDAHVLNQQEWKTSDTEIGVTVSLTPRINDDGTITILAVIDDKKSGPMKVVLRGKFGDKRTLMIRDGKLVESVDGNPIKISISAY